MALLLKEKPGLVGGSNTMGEIEVPKMDAALLMTFLEESHCEEHCNEEQLNILMESLEAEIRMASHGLCSIEGDMEGNDGFDRFKWNETAMVLSSPSDDMDWHVEDHIEEISMDDLVQFGIDFPHNCYEIPVEYGYSSLWQETYDTTIYN